MRRLLLLLIAAVLPFSGCNCHDSGESGWSLEDDFEFGEDAGADVSIDVRPPSFNIDAWGQEEPDVADVDDEPVDPWQSEEVEPGVERTHALTDRTSLAVDADGTLWLGYHTCSDIYCSESTLRVVHRPVDGDWSGEDIREHEGIFGVSVVGSQAPIVVFPDILDRTFKAAHRQADGSWDLRTFPVSRSSGLRGDGFDVTQDGTRYFATFAPADADEVDLFSYNPSADNPLWQQRTPLSVANPQAAMERGLRADPGEGVYLVNRDGFDGAYGVHRYDEDADAWPQSVELDEYPDVFVHSLYITDTFELCLSSNHNQRLLVTCGSMFDLTRDVDYFSSEVLAERHPSSVIEGDDGTLYVAYNPDRNEELRVASRDPDAGTWQVETVFDGPSYGVSTAIAHSGDLVISFYTCDDDDRCSLQVLWETPE